MPAWKPKFNKMSSNKSSFSQYLSLFWPVRQSRAAVEPNLGLSQNTPISWYTYCYTWICILGWVLWNRNSLEFKFDDTRLSSTETANRAENLQCQDSTNFFLMGPICFLYYKESLVSSNLNSKLLWFHSVRPNVYGVGQLSNGRPLLYVHHFLKTFVKNWSFQKHFDTRNQSKISWKQ